MTSLQKVIKYCATAFAIFLIVAIIGGISTGLLAITGISSFKNQLEEKKENAYIENEKELKPFELSGEKIEKVEIDVLSANIVIETGDEFSVKYSGDDFEFEQKNNKLEIENDSKLGAVGQLLIKVPEKMEFKKFSLSSGAGNMSIKNLTCYELDFDLGAGKTNIDSLTVKSCGEIDAGAGELNVTNGNMNNVEISLGLGKCEIRALFKGKSSVDTGLGQTNLVLLGSKENYTLKCETGLGEFKVENERLTKNSTVGQGESFIEVDGDIGKVNINFE